MLLGLGREEQGTAARLLRSLLDEERVATLVQNLSKAPPRATNQNVQLSPGTQKVIELSVEEARRLGHTYIGAEDLLLGLLRQADPVVIEILSQVQVSLEQVTRLLYLRLDMAATRDTPLLRRERLKTPLEDQ